MNINVFRLRCILFIFAMLFAVTQCFADLKNDTNQKIEQLRKGSFNIKVVNGQEPLTGVKIQIKQVKHHFGFGSCINYNISNPQYCKFFKDHFEWAVMENESKWYSNEAEQGMVTYEQADKIYNWCAENGIEMRGHCIFWEKPNRVQQWIKDLEYAPLPAQSPLRSAVERRLNSAVNHFKGKFVHWDINNEMLAGSFYKDRLGEEIISWMFNETHRLDPGCLLFVNEYDVLWAGRYDTARYENFIENLLAKSLPIHGIGIQGHIEANFSRDGVKQVYDNLAKFKIPIWITEFDVNSPDENSRADDLEDFFRLSFSHPAVEGIMLWGFWQDSHWRKNCWIVNSDWTLNEAGRRYESLIKEWTTIDSADANENGIAQFRGFYGKYEITASANGKVLADEIIDVLPNGPKDFTVQLPSNNNLMKTNLLINPGLEEGTNGWSGRGCSITADSNQKHSGLKSAKVFARTDTWQGIKQSLLGKLENHKTYRISGWVKLENADTANVQLTIAQADSEDSAYINIASAAANNAGWVELAGDFTLNYKGELGTLDVYFEGPPAGINFYIDDVNVYGPPAPPPKPLDKNAAGTIDASLRYQVFEGFGAAGGYDPNWLVAHPKKDELYKLMFADLGLEIYRIQNLHAINETYVDNTAEIIRAANKILSKPVKVMIASWSPPAYLKNIDHTTAGTLKKNSAGKYMYDEFADWWFESVKDLSARGITVDYLSIQNECDIETGYASCKFMPSEDANWAGYNLALEAVYRKLHSEFGEKMPKLLAPETMGFGNSRRYIDAIIDPNHVYAWTHHLYSDGAGGYDHPEAYVAALRKYAQKYAGRPFFQTEYSRNPDFNDAVFTARHIHNCLVHENLASYSYWSLFRKDSGGLITLSDPIGSEGFTINPTYYAFKQFSAFIDDNWQRIDAQTNSSALRISAFINPQNDRISVVVINISPDTDISLSLANAAFDISSGEIYRTSKTENCRLVGNFEKDKPLIVAKNSITTISIKCALLKGE